MRSTTLEYADGDAEWSIAAGVTNLADEECFLNIFDLSRSVSRADRYFE